MGRSGLSHSQAMGRAGSDTGVRAHRDSWVEVSAASPCLACDGDHGCSRSGTGFITCRRGRTPPSGYVFLKEHGGGWTFRPRSSPHPQAMSNSHLLVRYRVAFERTDRSALRAWARKLGVSGRGMIAFGCAVTHQSGQPVLLSAERNSDHDIVGLAQRFPNGDKRVVKGSQRGLIRNPTASTQARMAWRMCLFRS